MSDLLPLFPLNTVLFPGIPLPLHIFEERYRLLMSELMERTGPRRFGIVAIRQGEETDDSALLHDVGCVAELRRVEPYSDGRMDIVTTGGPRFRLRSTDDSRPYLLGSVDYLPETAGEGAVERALAVTGAFTDYWRTVAELRGEPTSEVQLPADPALLSYLVAAAVQVDLPEKQQLLGVPDTASRLRRELSILRRETALARTAIDRPPEVPTAGPFSLN